MKVNPPQGDNVTASDIVACYLWGVHLVILRPKSPRTKHNATHAAGEVAGTSGELLSESCSSKTCSSKTCSQSISTCSVGWTKLYNVGFARSSSSCFTDCIKGVTKSFIEYICTSSLLLPCQQVQQLYHMQLETNACTKLQFYYIGDLVTSIWKAIICRTKNTSAATVSNQQVKRTQ